MELEMERIELPSSAFAMVYKELLRKTARLHEATLRKYMTPKKDAVTKVAQSELVATPDADTAKYAIDYDIDLLAMEQDKAVIDSIYILNQVAEWAYGPVNQATLELVPERDYKVLVKELDRLYKPSPLAKGG